MAYDGAEDRESRRLYRIAADEGEAGAQVNLGLLCAEEGGGLPSDEAAAARLFKLAADQGKALGRAYLGDFHERGCGGLPQDIAVAVRFYRLAADQGNGWAETALARLGRQREEEEAQGWREVAGG